MAEHHDNSRPCSKGTIAISQHGVLNYFPIEDAKHLHPFIALFLHERTDGTLVAQIDVRFNRGQDGIFTYDE
jgi:hypothetical protein